MTEESRVYDGVPVAAVYDASLIALRSMDYVISEQSRANHQISTCPIISPWHATKQVLTDLVEIGHATRMKIGGALIHTDSGGDGLKIRQSILDGIEVEIQRIKDAGRIVPVEAPRYSFGTVVDPLPPVLPVVAAQPAAGVAAITPRKADATPEPDPKSGSSSGKWLVWLAIWVGILFLINTQQGQDVIASITGALNMPAVVSQYRCEDIADEAKGMSLQNAFGAKFEIVRVTDLKPLSKTDEMVVCTATIGLGNGTSQKMQISVEKGDSTAEVFIQVTPL